jgi:hypothetical protein
MKQFPLGYPDGAERTLDIMLVSGRQVRLWLDAAQWDEQQTRDLGVRLRDDDYLSSAIQADVVDYLCGGLLSGVNAAQVIQDAGWNIRAGVMVYCVPFERPL